MIYVSGTPVVFDSLGAFWRYLDIPTDSKLRTPAENRILGESLTAIRLKKSYMAGNLNTQRVALLTGFASYIFEVAGGRLMIRHKQALDLSIVYSEAELRDGNQYDTVEFFCEEGKTLGVWDTVPFSFETHYGDLGDVK